MPKPPVPGSIPYPKAQLVTRANQGIIFRISLTDSDAALQRVASDITDPIQSEKMLKDIGVWRTVRERDSAITWASQLPAEQRNSVMTGVVENLVGNHLLDQATAGFDQWLANDPTTRQRSTCWQSCRTDCLQHGKNHADQC